MKINLKKYEDKLAHVGAGAIIAFVLFWIISFWSIQMGMYFGFLGAIIAGILKEVYDELEEHGSASIPDFIATWIGGLLVIGSVQIVVLQLEIANKSAWFMP